MHMLLRLFYPRRGKNQDEIAARASKIFTTVLFDVGVDRLLNGSMLLDQQFRLCFYAVPPPPCSRILVCIPVAELAAARVFSTHMRSIRIDAPAMPIHVRLLVEDLMQELRTRSPAMRALPMARGAKALASGAG